MLYSTCGVALVLLALITNKQGDVLLGHVSRLSMRVFDGSTKISIHANSLVGRAPETIIP